MKNVGLTNMQVDCSTSMTVLVYDIKEKQDKNGKPYCIISISDGKDHVEAISFNTSVIQVHEELGGDYGLLFVQLTKTVYGNSYTYKIQDFVGLNDFSENCISDFVPHAPLDTGMMYDRILFGCKSISEKMGGNLYHLVAYVYENHQQDLRMWSAGKHMHHAYIGGLLYHTYRMFCSAAGMLSVYPEMDGELLLCGIALHDVGKLLEFTTSEIGSVTYTVDGNLFGHLHLGINMVKSAADALADQYDFVKLKLLLHMIGSHHGKQEWGAIMTPAIPEAYLLFLLDYNDAKLDQYFRATEPLESGSCSESCRLLDGTHVYKKSYDIDASGYQDFASVFLNTTEVDDIIGGLNE